MLRTRRPSWPPLSSSVGCCGLLAGLVLQLFIFYYQGYEADPYYYGGVFFSSFSPTCTAAADVFRRPPLLLGLYQMTPPPMTLATTTTVTTTPSGRAIRSLLPRTKWLESTTAGMRTTKPYAFLAPSSAGGLQRCISTTSSMDSNTSSTIYICLSRNKSRNLASCSSLLLAATCTSKASSEQVATIIEEEEEEKKDPPFPTLPRCGGGRVAHHLLVCGLPCTGKGTLCRQIAQRLGLVHISAGQLLRDCCDGNGAAAATTTTGVLGSSGTTHLTTDCAGGSFDDLISSSFSSCYASTFAPSVSTEVRRRMLAGELVPDELVTSLVMTRLLKPDCSHKGWVLDGFPRNVNQAKLFLKYQKKIYPLDPHHQQHQQYCPHTIATTTSGGLPSGGAPLSFDIHRFLLLSAPEDLLVNRAMYRRLDPKTGAIYNLITAPPPDRQTAERLVKREDDNQQTVRKRIQDQKQSIHDLIPFFSSILLELDGSKDVDYAFNQFENIYINNNNTTTNHCPIEDSTTLANTNCINNNSTTTTTTNTPTIHKPTSSSTTRLISIPTSRYNMFLKRINAIKSCGVVKSAVSITPFIAIDLFMYEFLTRAKVSFPSSLLGMVSLLSVLLSSTTTTTNGHSSLLPLLTPGSAFLQKFMTLFFVPSLLNVASNPPKQIDKWATVVATGAISTLLSSAAITEMVRKLLTKYKTTTATSTTTNQQRDDVNDDHHQRHHVNKHLTDTHRTPTITATTTKETTTTRSRAFPLYLQNLFILSAVASGGVLYGLANNKFNKCTLQIGKYRLLDPTCTSLLPADSVLLSKWMESILLVTSTIASFMLSSNMPPWYRRIFHPLLHTAAMTFGVMQLTSVLTQVPLDVLVQRFMQTYSITPEPSTATSRGGMLLGRISKFCRTVIGEGNISQKFFQLFRRVPKSEAPSLLSTLQVFTDTFRKACEQVTSEHGGFRNLRSLFHRFSPPGGGRFLSFFMGPAVVSLACQLYSSQSVLSDQLGQVIITCLLAAKLSMVGSVLMARQMGIHPEARLSAAGRSVTAPLAVEVSAMLKADPRLTVALVVANGLLASTIGPCILNALRITNPTTRGLAMGCAAQGLGISAMASEPLSLPFATVAVVLMGSATTALAGLPPVQRLLVSLSKGGVGGWST